MFDKPSLKGRALRYLAAREYSRFELEQKLKEYEEAEGELKAALDDLEAKGFISEARVVESTLNQKAGKFGAARLINTLKAKGINAGAILDAAAELKETELPFPDQITVSCSLRPEGGFDVRYGDIADVGNRKGDTRCRRIDALRHHDRKAARRVRPKDIGAQHISVSNLDRDVLLEQHLE